MHACIHTYMHKHVSIVIIVVIIDIDVTCRQSRYRAPPSPESARCLRCRMELFRSLYYILYTCVCVYMYVYVYIHI